METLVAFSVDHCKVDDWPAEMVDGLAMKNCTVAGAAAEVVTCTRACPVPPRLSVTTTRKIYACPAAATKVVIGLFGFESVTDGSPSSIHWNFRGRPSGE